ncbi:MAG: 50S ribosomal protein L17 [Flavobacteriales bacterium]
MRHGKTINHLGRTASHRKALLSNLAAQLITHKRITTTVAKAKALRKFVEPIITKAKDDTTHSRRIVFSYLGYKYAVSELVSEVSAKEGSSPGGYTRIIKLGVRPGDGAEMALIELVDFNANLTKDSAKAGKKRTRRGSGSGTAKPKAAKEEAPKEEPKAEESANEETPEENA